MIPFRRTKNPAHSLPLLGYTYKAMKYKITTLVENCVYSRKLKAEHGLSILIETAQHKILFDTGQSDQFIANARLLNIDIKEIDYLILSHGHSDHTGGLRAFLQENPKATVYCKKECMQQKFKLKRENGLEDAGSLPANRFHFVDSEMELAEGIHLFPDIRIYNPDDIHMDHFFTINEQGRIPDEFLDEQAVALVSDTNYAIISACSHRGITNILETIQAYYPDRKCTALVGGFHIHNAEKAKSDIIADYLIRHEEIEKIGVCHCTGVDKYAELRQRLGERVFYNHTGYSFTIDL